MHIERLRLSDFRCFAHADIAPASGINVITGDNASGKTSLLEAIFFLGRGQSFRRPAANPAIRADAEAFVVHGEIANPEGRSYRLGVRRSRSVIEYKRDDKTANRLDLVNALPLQLVDPNVHRLLEQGPRYRRHFLDWGVFHVEHIFFPAWCRYRRALRQRNRALKSRRAKKDVIAWDAELVKNAELVDACRRRYIAEIRERLPARVNRIFGSDTVLVEYAPGWRGEEGFGVALAVSLEQDMRAGFTQQGPHRADLKVSVADVVARDWVSRGQQKMLSAALLLVQAELLQQSRGLKPVLLFDDLAAELGTDYRQKLASEISGLGCQCFLTFLEPALVPESMTSCPRFHVEHGDIQKMQPAS